MSLFHTHEYHDRTVPYEKSVTVNEHRAPTDDSIRILYEMQQKARESIISMHPLEGNNLITDAKMFTERNRDTYSLQVWARFKINGKEFRTKPFPVEEPAFVMAHVRERVFIPLHDAILSVIAEQAVVASVVNYREGMKLI